MALMISVFQDNVISQPGFDQTWRQVSRLFCVISSFYTLFNNIAENFGNFDYKDKGKVNYHEKMED